MPDQALPWPTHLILLSGPDPSALAEAIDHVRQRLAGAPEQPISLLAAELARRQAGLIPRTTPPLFRLALTANDASDLLSKLHTAQATLTAKPAQILRARSGIFYAPPSSSALPLMAWLFPGLGAQHPHLLTGLPNYFPHLSTWLEELDRVAGHRGFSSSRLMFSALDELSIQDQERAQTCLSSVELGGLGTFTTSMALNDLLRGLGLKPDLIAGHSIGENAAMNAAGMLPLDRPTLLDLAHDLAELLDACPHRVRSLAASLPDKSLLPALLAEYQGEVFWAMDNCPNQVVLMSRTAQVLRSVAERLRQMGGLCLDLPLDRPFHTPLFADQLPALASLGQRADYQAGDIGLFSSVSGQRFPDDLETINQLALSQWTNRVNFQNTLEVLYSLGARCFIEVGPGNTLTGFVSDTFRGRPHLALPASQAGGSGLSRLLQLLGELFVRGVPWDPTTLYPSSAATPSTTVRPRLQEPGDLDPGPESMLRPANASRTEAVTGHFPRSPEEPSLSHAARSILFRNQLLLMTQFMSNQARMCSVIERFVNERPAGSSHLASTTGSAAWPMLGDLVERGPDRVVWQRLLDPKRDIFLCDHAFGRQVSLYLPDLKPLMVLPLAVGLEIMAEASASLWGQGLVVCGMEQIRASRWLALDSGKLELRVEASRALAPKGFSSKARAALVRIFSLEENHRNQPLLALEGIVILDERLAPAPPASEMVALGPASFSPAYLYEKYLFHGPLFQGIDDLNGWGADGISALLCGLGDRQLVQGVDNSGWILPSVALDCLGQMAACWLLSNDTAKDFSCFPIGIGSLRLHAPGWRSAGDRLSCRSQVSLNGEILSSSHWLTSQDGRLLLTVAGFTQRVFRLPMRLLELLVLPASQVWLSDPWPLPAADNLCLRKIDLFSSDLLQSSHGVWARMLAHLTLSAGERATFYALPSVGPRRGEWLLGRLAAKDAIRHLLAERIGMDLAPSEVEIIADNGGRPSAQCVSLPNGSAQPRVSLSHCNSVAVAAADLSGAHELGLGVDYEILTSRDLGDWLGQAFRPEELELAAQGGKPELLAFWCAKEAAAKALGVGLQGRPQAFKILRRQGEGLGLIVDHEGRQLEVRVTRSGDELLAVCQTQPGASEARSTHDTAGN